MSRQCDGVRRWLCPSLVGGDFGQVASQLSASSCGTRALSLVGACHGQIGGQCTLHTVREVPPGTLRGASGCACAPARPAGVWALSDRCPLGSRWRGCQDRKSEAELQGEGPGQGGVPGERGPPARGRGREGSEWVHGGRGREEWGAGESGSQQAGLSPPLSLFRSDVSPAQCCSHRPPSVLGEAGR